MESKQYKVIINGEEKIFNVGEGELLANFKIKYPTAVLVEDFQNDSVNVETTTGSTENMVSNSEDVSLDLSLDNLIISEYKLDPEKIIEIDTYSNMQYDNMLKEKSNLISNAERGEVVSEVLSKLPKEAISSNSSGTMRGGSIPNLSWKILSSPLVSDFLGYIYGEGAQASDNIGQLKAETLHDFGLTHDTKAHDQKINWQDGEFVVPEKTSFTREKTNLTPGFESREIVAPGELGDYELFNQAQKDYAFEQIRLKDKTANNISRTSTKKILEYIKENDTI